MEKHDKRGEEQTPAVEARDKEHRGKHHEVSPVVDSAVDTAFVLHEKCLERTEEQDADVVAEEEEHRQHQQVCRKQNSQKTEDAEYRIKRKPDQHDNKRCNVLLLDIFCKR